MHKCEGDNVLECVGRVIFQEYSEFIKRATRRIAAMDNGAKWASKPILEFKVILASGEEECYKCEVRRDARTGGQA